MPLGRERVNKLGGRRTSFLIYIICEMKPSLSNGNKTLRLQEVTFCQDTPMAILNRKKIETISS